MTAAYRLKGLGWLGGVTVLSLAFYLVSLQVAAERKKLEQLNGRIASSERDIRALETEFDTRANLTQLERWNGNTLALSSPQPGQFVADEAQLAAIDPVHVGAPDAGVRTAALLVPSLPSATATLQAPTIAIAAAAPAPTPAPAAVHRQQVASASTPPVAAVAAATRSTSAASASKARPEMAMLDRKLLSDSTLGDLLSGARSEGGRR